MLDSIAKSMINQNFQIFLTTIREEERKKKEEGKKKTSREGRKEMQQQQSTSYLSVQSLSRPKKKKKTV